MTYELSENMSLSVHETWVGLELVFWGGAHEETAHGWALVYGDRLYDAGYRCEISSSSHRSVLTVNANKAARAEITKDISLWAAKKEASRE